MIGDLGSVLSIIRIPGDDLYNMWCWETYNAHIGSREPEDQWGVARGPHGYACLSHCSPAQSTACNTWFQKNIHMATWQHPKSKSWFCIDYILMKQKDKNYSLQLCMDAAVKRGVECNTVHSLHQLFPCPLHNCLRIATPDSAAGTSLPLPQCCCCACTSALRPQIYRLHSSS